MADIELVVPQDFNQGLRLDKFIAENKPDMNRSKLKAGLVEIKVNGKSQKVSYKVKPGDKIQIAWEDKVPDDIEPENIPLDIIYEDENVTVVNKKQGMVTHPACGNWSGTLVNALLYHWGRQAVTGLKENNENDVKQRPGIVHRLDKDTSGIIITARNRNSEEWLQKQFKNHKSLTKEYICICQGRPHKKSGTIITNIARDPRDRKKFKAVELNEPGRYAKSYYKCIACYGEYSLMRVRIATGRTHQIRVHMKYINCPILGDPIYSKQDKLFPKATLMLNARMLKICLPGNTQQSTFVSPTPERFIEVQKKLKKNFSKVILGD